MSRRRSYEDDDDDDLRYRKRRRVVSEPREIENKLESLILRVGEKSTSSLESNLEQLSGVLFSDLSSFKANVLKILVDCAQKMPEKTSIYSTLVGLLNAKSYSFGGELVETLVRALKEALRAAEWDTARNCVRFLADLVNCKVVDIASLVTLLENFISVTAEENTPQVRSDWYVLCVLSCLPLVGRELHERREQELDRLLRLIDAYISRRSKTHVPALMVWSSDSPHMQEEYLDCLWSAICKMRSDKWAENHLARPYLAFDGVLSEALQHSLATVAPPPHSPETHYPFPWVVFRLFDYTDCPEGPPLPGAHSIERFLIEEHLHRLIRVHHLERKSCAAALLSFPGKSKVPFEYMITEVIFAELFQLPNSPQIEICYGSLLLELCKLQPSTMPLVLAQTVELLYERLETMNVSCVDRFCSWFAYHLSNFQFRWTWEEWLDAAALPQLHPKPMFVQGALAKCLRLSYHQRLVEIIPAELQPFVPAAPLPVIKYGEQAAEDTPGLAISKKLAEAIQSRCTEDEALEILNEIDNAKTQQQLQPGGGPDEDVAMMDTTPNLGGLKPELLKIDVFVHTLLAIACKTMSHSFAAIAKFHFVMKKLAGQDAPDRQVQILLSLYEIWKNHPQMMQGIIDKLLKTQVIDASAVANWVFSEELKADFTKAYLWEILHSTIRIKIKQVKRLQTELDQARARRDDPEEDEPPPPEDLERAEERLETAQGELKKLFLIILQRFIMLLTEHISTNEAEGADVRTPWFRLTQGRLLEVLFRHHEHVANYISTLQSLLFSSDVDPHILAVYEQFLALRN
ncbi:nuclear cap-binding protein subunit 1-like [Varroa jacobsoni]|uniref:Nuclear cap-binding protein subunit 1 n=1 Tax=Varroa destructor TaxID=109461 RepID=A0A7M7K8J4_VARDE|nr:nuclear cap-binding protein subunit 1-like [Varroa destructor]XP_022709490.1 nuclear cap-binding protein subunit 1-like [Varroa jacobsoni]